MDNRVPGSINDFNHWLMEQGEYDLIFVDFSSLSTRI